jgi:hypothetical protein
VRPGFIEDFLRPSVATAKVPAQPVVDPELAVSDVEEEVGCQPDFDSALSCCTNRPIPRMASYRICRSSQIEDPDA